MRTIHADTAWVLLAAAVFFLEGLLLGVWKWIESASSPDGQAHRYVDVSHLSGFAYAFATAFVAIFVELSAWPPVVNRTAAAVVVGLFAVTVGNYIRLAVRRRTDNQMRQPHRSHIVVLLILMTGVFGGFAVLLAGFIANPDAF